MGIQGFCEVADWRLAHQAGHMGANDLPRGAEGGGEVILERACKIKRQNARFLFYCNTRLTIDKTLFMLQYLDGSLAEVNIKSGHENLKELKMTCSLRMSYSTFLQDGPLILLTNHLQPAPKPSSHD